MRRPVPTLIIDERTLRREGLAALLEGTRYDVTAAVAGGTEAVPPDINPPGLIVLGLSADMPRAVADIHRLHSLLPDSRIVMVGESSDRCDAHELILSGAAGCIVGIGSQEALIKALDLAMLDHRIVVLGDGASSASDASSHSQMHDDATPLPRAADGAGARRLSDREKQILGCIARGETNKTIARACGISEATVKVHLKTILRKIGAHNRTQAAIWAINTGLASEDGAGPAIPIDAAAVPERRAA